MRTRGARRAGRGRSAWLALGAGALIAALAGSCGARPPELVTPQSAAPVAPRASIAQDRAPKQEPRLVPAEAYLRTYAQLFGGLAPLDVQARARGGDGAQLFDDWSTYLTAIGMPDHRFDVPRGTQTNATMLATFERLGEALCDRAVEHDLAVPKGGAPRPLAERTVFAFELAADAPASASSLTRAAFAPRFDVLHRTFLGYPAELAPTDRTGRFLALWQEVASRHAAAGAPKSRLAPALAAWSATCVALLRHPEFQLY
jgi:hypothetical protein